MRCTRWRAVANTSSAEEEPRDRAAPERAATVAAQLAGRRAQLQARARTRMASSKVGLAPAACEQQRPPFSDDCRQNNGAVDFPTATLEGGCGGSF